MTSAAVAAALLGATLVTTTVAQAAVPSAPSKAQGPCDIYAAGGTPCVAAHSTTRALYAGYGGPLYKVRRLSDNASRNIGLLSTGGYADAAAQDSFCADTTCLITTVYDQSPKHNDLTQPPRGAFSGPAMGGANNLPIADMAPITVNGHKAYGAFIEPGMGLRNNNTRGIAVDDQPEGMYWMVDGQHYNNGCCFDYGNTEIDSHDDGDGTMETSYFGNAPWWYHGTGNGPWVMTDQENNLVGCVNPGSDSKLCADLPPINDRFVTAVAKGEPHHWASLGGDAQQGPLTTMFDGPRVGPSYDPMRKQGGIVLGNGGDNSNGSQGTFYEGVMTAGYPSDATDQLVQANIVAAKYGVQRLSLAPASATVSAPGLQTFSPGSHQDVAESFTNTTGKTVDVALSLRVPKGWSAKASGPATFAAVAPDHSVTATFTVTAAAQPFTGDLNGQAAWRNSSGGTTVVDTASEKVRNTSPIKINEFRIGTAGNATNSYVELYNAGSSSVDVSGWTLTERPTQQAVFSTIAIPAGTTIAGHGRYLLGLSNAGLAAPTKAGDTALNVSSTTGMHIGDTVTVDNGPNAESAKIANILTSGASGPRVPGKIGTAVKLNGADEYVALPDGIVSGLSDFTVSAWVNPSADSTWSRIFDFGSGTGTYMFMSVNGGGSGLRFAITTSSNGGEQQLTGGGQLPLNTWSHVAVTLSGTTGTLYLNGVAVATNPNMTLHPSDLGATNQNYIGKSQWPDPLLNGTVDDFAISNRALSAAEVASLAGGQAAAGNVADYAFDEATGETAVDSSGNGNNATIVSQGAGATSTPLWQPMPDGPITVPAGSTNVPVTSTAGFKVGQRVAIGYGSTLEVATVTAVGLAGAQEMVVAPAPAGATNIKVSSTANISVGDKIRLDIGSRIENVTVAAVGTGGAGGTGLDLTSPLTISHSANLPFSDRGTGVSFTPATRFSHSSNEPVQALGGGIVLDHPLARSHAINAPLRDAAVTTAGYQGNPAPDQWFGGPALSTSAGSMQLADARGNVADSLNYGLLVDPWLAEGYQGGVGYGCTVATPPMTSGAGKSASRFPDGGDTDSNCVDFLTANATPGADNNVALDPGPQVSLQVTTAGSTSDYIKHDDADDLVVTAPITAGSSQTDKQDATWVEAAGLADPSCVSFESVNRPGSYLRHQNFQFHLAADDGSALFANDATFCPQAGNSGEGTSFASVNFPTKFIRTFNNSVDLASNGGDNPWDTTTGWASDSSWLVDPPWAPAT